MDIVYKKKNKLSLWMLSICMKHEYCKHRHLLRMLMWLGMTHSSDIRVFWRVLFCYTQQRKGLPGNVGKVHNQSSSHTLLYSLHTGSLAVVANVSVILIYRDRFHNFCFKLCNVFTWMFDNKCTDWICEQLVCTHIFFAKHLHWNASWILHSTLLIQCMWLCVVLNLIPVNLNACNISSVKQRFVHLCFDTTTIPFSFSCRPLILHTLC